MKKTKIAFFIILILGYIGTLFGNPLNTSYIYAKHIILFLIIGMISYLILNKVTKKTILRLNLEGAKESIALSLKVLAFGGILVLTSVIQMDYISYSETPLVKNCKYYDDYSNLIYVGLYYDNCPELEITENTDSTLSFKISNLLEGTMDNYRFYEDDQDTTTVDMRISNFSETSIDYDLNHRISSVSLNTSSILETYSTTESRISHYTYSLNVVNSYDGGFRQENKSASYSEEIDQVPSILTHHGFSEEDFETITYYSGVLSEDSEFVLYKEYIEDDILVTEIQSTISYLDFNSGVKYEVEDAFETTLETTYDEEVRIYDGSVEVLGTLIGLGSTNFYTKYESRNGYNNLIFTGASSINDPGESWETARTFTYQVVSGKEYIVRSSSSEDFPYDFTVEDTIYELQKYDYGVVVKELDYPNDSYIKHLLQPDTSIKLINTVPYARYSTSIFDVGYHFNILFPDDIIYSKPAYMYLD